MQRDDKDWRIEDLRIASPCPATWAEMRGDERVRLCLECRLHVYDLSEMTRAEATELIRSREGRTCVRLRRRRDGRVITRDCPVGRRLRLLKCAGVAALLLFAWVLYGASRVRPSARPSRSVVNVIDRGKDFLAHQLGFDGLCTCPPFLMGAIF